MTLGAAEKPDRFAVGRVDAAVDLAFVFSRALYSADFLKRYHSRERVSNTKGALAATEPGSAAITFLNLSSHVAVSLNAQATSPK
jgi:hypothetical protein